MATGPFCQFCGVEAPSKHVSFHRLIGMIVFHYSSHYDGYMCRRCARRIFWDATLITALLGWWGIISAIVTPFLLVNNVVHYLRSFRLPRVGPDAVPPPNDPILAERLQPYRSELRSRLRDGDDLMEVAEEIGRRAGVAPLAVARQIGAIAALSLRPESQIIVVKRKDRRGVETQPKS